MEKNIERTLVVVPAYGQYQYVALAVASAIASSPKADVLVVDDASPDKFAADVGLDRLAAIHGDRFGAIRLAENAGLHVASNLGLKSASLRGYGYACVANSDVVFATGWLEPALAALAAAALVGPVTNAPGSEAWQHVGDYSPVWAETAGVDDFEERIARTQADLAIRQGDRVKFGTLNGFCLVARTATWFKHAHAPDEPFSPEVPFNAAGQPNPTPRLTLGEYDLQRRWHAAGLKSAAALGSFVFHWRSATRGRKYAKGDWMRLPDPG